MDSEDDTPAHVRGGLPHSEIPGSPSARLSPGLFAACRVLHRLSVPRHPPDALVLLLITREPGDPPPGRPNLGPPLWPSPSRSPAAHSGKRRRPARSSRPGAGPPSAAAHEDRFPGGARPPPAKGSRPRRSAAVACTNSLHPVKQPAAPPAGPLAHGPAPNPVNPAAPSRRPTLTTGRCGGDRARTGALLRAKQALSQLSYTPIRPTPARPHRSRPIPRGPTRTGQSAPARRRSSVFPAGGPGRI